MTPFMTKPPSSSYKLTTHLSDQGLDYAELSGDNVAMRIDFEASIVMLQVLLKRVKYGKEPQDQYKVDKRRAELQDPPSAPQLPKWVRATRDAAGALADDPTYQRRTQSQFDRASSLLVQALANYDPDTFVEASGHPNWDATMNEEYHSLLANDTWDLVPLSKGRKLVRCKWVYKTKYGPDGKVDKHKARLVAKEFSQVEGIGYTETFSPVAKIAEASPLLVGFTDFDWVGDPDDRKSTTGYVFTLGLGPITWACKKQSVISLSSAEAEYHGVVEASKEAMWLRQILSEFGFQQQHLTTLWCDNQSVIQLCKDPVQHQRSKHIELHMYFIKNLIHDHVLEVKHCSTDDQIADIFTKALTEAKFTKLQFMVGVQEVVTKGG
eukprot:PITA_27551